MIQKVYTAGGSMSSAGVVIYGASKPHKGGGGHGKVVADILANAGVTVYGFIDDNPENQGQSFFGYPVYGGCDKLEELKAAGSLYAIIAIGDNCIRRKIADIVRAASFEFACALHPSAVIASSATIGAGTVIAATAVVNPAATVGEHCIINTGAAVEHDNIIGSFVHIAPGVNLGGRVSVGDGSAVFTNATVLPDVTIGKNCVIGAGAVVLKDVPDGVTVVGNPARIVQKR